MGKQVRRKKPRVIKSSTFRVYFALELHNCYRDVEADSADEAMEMVDGDWADMNDINKSDPVTIRAEHVEKITK